MPHRRMGIWGWPMPPPSSGDVLSSADLYRLSFLAQRIMAGISPRPGNDKPSPSPDTSFSNASFARRNRTGPGISAPCQKSSLRSFSSDTMSVCSNDYGAAYATSCSFLITAPQAAPAFSSACSTASSVASKVRRVEAWRALYSRTGSRISRSFHLPVGGGPPSFSMAFI